MARKVTTLNRWENILTDDWAVNSTNRYTKQSHFDPDRWLRSVLINVQGTVAVGVANATALLADNVGAIIESVHMRGKNSFRGTSDDFFHVRGCDLKELSNNYHGVKIFDNSSALAVATGNYTLDFNILIDFPPPKLRVEEQLGYLLDLPNWTSFEFLIQFADANNLWNPAGTTTFTWSNQTVRLLGRYAQESQKFAGYSVGLRYLQLYENADDLAVSANQKNLIQLDNKGRIRSLFLKTGVKATTVTGGNNAYASLSDAILNNVRVIEVPSQKFREYGRFTDIKAAQSATYKYNPATGYALIDFVADGLPFEALNPANIATGAAKTTNLYLQADVTGAAGQALCLTQENLYYSDRIVIPKA